ncbi:AraC family transcriptional regulator [Flavitalea sp. BT771]|uniref:helix-turn-helix domain-containing protein n=1 Tax=Flavitalea sp. BT771 TaxID=3063329 RepID=UPI0026E3CED7|nr:AraC family transcriptional regulator [Flavitalea sp. BT771]MDO6434181.1 AraC family transcriptional regulator [Flavitalea sp. BT771]MDV6223081.1 AraC family transcriptional regulator [Flavitalea sp. BT771]
MEVAFYDKHGKKTDIDFSGIFSPQVGRQKVREVRKNLDLPFVSAESVQLSVQDFDILYGDMRMKEWQRAYFNTSSEPEHIEMHFTLAGEGFLRNENNGKSYHFSSNQQNLHYMPQFVGSSQYDEGAFHKFFEVRFSKDFFLELAADSSPVLMDFADQVANSKAVDVCAQNLPISFAMHQCINEILHMQLDDGLRRMFLQSKCIELLSLQAQAYEDINGKVRRACKTTYDKERIYFVRDYLVEHAACPPSLTELAKVAGLNEFKLKKGFKEVFNTSVFGYLSDFRLNEARNGLLSGGMPIKEVSEHFGYSSVQHFTKAFKKKFGVTPGAVK